MENKDNNFNNSEISQNHETDSSHETDSDDENDTVSIEIKFLKWSDILSGYTTFDLTLLK